MTKRIVRNFVIVLLVLLLTGAVLATIWASTIPLFTWRMAAVNAYSVVPAASVRLELRLALQKQDFQAALKLLDRQKRIAEAIGLTNFMKHDLVENTGFVLRQARLLDKESLFASWLTELKQIAPREYRLLPMLAMALSRSDPGAAEKSALEAIALLPIDELPYRSLIKIRLAHDPVRLNEICQNYGTAQLGSFHTWYYHNKGAIGQDVRTLVVSVNTAQGNDIYNTSQGLELGKTLTSEFNFDQTLPSTRFNLILPTAPGIKLKIHQVKIEGPSETAVFEPEQLFIAPTFGYVLSASEVILISEEGESIAVQARTGSFPPFGRISLTYQLDKLALFNGSDCLKKPVQ